MTKYTLLIKISDEIDQSVKDYYLNYKPSHKDDSGLDLPTCKNVTIDRKNPFGTIEFGISCAMIDNTTNNFTGFYLYPRSSFSKYPLLCSNSVGIIDAGYRGEIKGKVRWIPFKNENVFSIEQNLKLFQICAPDLSAFKINIVSELPDSTRGSNGFGSTGN